MDIEIDEASPLREKELVYLADKLLQGRRVVDPETRILQKMESYASKAEALSAIRTRLDDVLKIKARLENMTNKSLENILGVHDEGSPVVLLGREQTLYFLTFQMKKRPV